MTSWRLKRRLIVWAVAIVALHVVQEITLGTKSWGPFFAELLESSAAGAAAVLCFGASRRANDIGRLFWTLIGLAMASACITDLAWVYAEGLHHTFPVENELIRFLPYIRIALFTMVLFLNLEEISPGPDLGVLLDSIQVAIMFLFIYILVDYIPGHTLDETAGIARGVKIWLVVRVALVLLAGAQAVHARTKQVRSLFIGFTMYLGWYLVGEGTASYLMAVTRAPSGSVLDLAWTFPHLALAFWAGCWVPASGSVSAAPARSMTIRELMWTNATFSLAPLIVLLQITQLGSEFQLLRYSLLGVSFLCFAGRLGLSEVRRSRNQDELRRQEVVTRSAREDLFVQEAFLEQLIETAPEAIAIVDSHLMVQRINREFTRLFGYQPGDAAGKHLDSLILPADRTEESDRLCRQAGSGNAAALETVRRNREGTLIDVSILGSNVMLRGEHIASFVIYRDIRERKRAEEELRQSQKLEAVGRLAGGVAHDFNNLLTVINGYGDLLLRRFEEGHFARPQLMQIRMAGERAAELTRQLLAFSRKQIIQLKPLDLNQIVTQSQMMFSRLIGEQVELTTHLSPTLGKILADSGQIHQVIMNLLANARDAMPNGGKLTIETENVEFDAAFAASHPDARPGAHVLLAVRDTGVGMSAETRQHIFEPFYTTKGVESGTGLGLTTVYGIVQGGNGWISVDSEPGKGTTFRIYLPRTDVIAQPASPASAPTQTAGSETLLIVEDREDVRQLAVAVLSAHGYRVLEAANGDEALSVAQGYDAAIDLVVADVVLPGISGPVTADRLQNQRPGLKVLFTSGYTAGALKSDARYIAKPYTPEGLVAKVQEVLHHDGRTP